MKRCYKCKQEKLLECFSKNAHCKDGLSAQCKECHKIMRKEHYEKNKQKILLQVYKKQDEYCEWLDGLKNKPCTDCHISYPHYVMDFDHVGNDKEFSVSHARRGNWGREKILKEISKCELVCANCHRERTHKRICGIGV